MQMSAYAQPLQFTSHHLDETAGVSEASAALTELLADLNRHIASAVTFGDFTEDTKYDVIEVFREARKGDWDGYGARPVSLETLVEALAFVRAIPHGVAQPAVVPEPTGEVAFEWSSGSKQFVVSLSGESVATFAGLLGGEARIHGTDRFIGSIPQEMRQILLRHFATQPGATWAG